MKCVSVPLNKGHTCIVIFLQFMSLDDVIYKTRDLTQSGHSNSFPCFYIKGMLWREFSVLYLYIDIQMKSVVLDVFFLKKKKKEIFFLAIFRLLWIENQISSLGKWDSNLRPNIIYVSSLLAARL